jgi:hypothetical protein
VLILRRGQTVTVKMLREEGACHTVDSFITRTFGKDRARLTLFNLWQVSKRNRGYIYWLATKMGRRQAFVDARVGQIQKLDRVPTRREEAEILWSLIP